MPPMSVASSDRSHRTNVQCVTGLGTILRTVGSKIATPLKEKRGEAKE